MLMMPMQVSCSAYDGHAAACKCHGQGPTSLEPGFGGGLVVVRVWGRQQNS